MVIYLDGFMGLNFLVDWLLLLGVNRLCGNPPGSGRTAAAAALGGGYAGACLLPGCGFLAGSLWRWASLGVMSLVAFGMSRSALRRGRLFVLLSMALGGLAISARTNCPWGLIGCAGALTALCHLGFHGRADAPEQIPMVLERNGRRVALTALRDTGNLLRDPITGESVLVADAEIGDRLLGLSPEELGHPVETMQARPELRLRLLRYATAGSEGGFLLALRCRQVTKAGKTVHRTVAFSPVRLGDGTYQALTGGTE